VGLSPEQLVSFFIIAEASDVDLQAISLPPIGIPRTLCTISGVNLKEKPFDKVQRWKSNQNLMLAKIQVLLV